ncbi:MAG: hypothetical protein QG602_2890, partial [Verrucomicrobiota bacterium]|nr:hypothetical protein [Verrucomicrobiota bacterium]
MIVISLLFVATSPATLTLPIVPRFVPLRSLCRRISAGGAAVCALLLLPAWSAAAEESLIPQLSQRTWQQADGLPGDDISGICQDPAGYLWVATWSGLARFDGANFRNYDLAGDGRSGGPGVAAIAEDPAGDGVWAAPLGGGLLRLRAGRFEPHPLPGGYAERRIARLLVAADGALWICFEGGDVMRLLGERHEVFGEEAGLVPRRSTQIATDGSGRVWLANGPLLLRYEAGVLHPFPPGEISENIRIASARQDGPWVLTRGWLRKVVGDRLPVKIKVNAAYNAYSVQALLEDSQGAIWTGTRARGVRRLTLPDDSDLIITAPDDIGVLFEDRTGNLWAGANGGGLVRLRPSVARLFGKEQGLLDQHVLGVCEDQAGTMWVADRDGGVAYLNDQGRLHTLAPPPMRETLVVRSVAPAGAAGVWVLTSHGIWRADRSGRLTQEGVVTPADHGNLRVTHTTRNGDLWAALEPARLGRLRAGVWQEFTPANGLGPGQIHAIAEDAAGRIWVGTEESRLYRETGDRFEEVPLAAARNLGGIQALHFDGNGTGWIGTAGGGLLRVGDTSDRTLTEAHGLPTRNLTQIISDDQGGLWFGSPEGIFRVRREELEAWFAGRRPRVDAAFVGADDGLKEAPCATAHHPSVWKSRDGLLWFATRQGVVAIDPRREQPDVPPLVARVDAVRAGGAALPLAAAVRIPALAHAVELYYSVLCLPTPGRVRTLVRLRGYDDDWLPADARGLARYTRLPPGDYVFEIAARVAGRPASDTVFRLPVVVAAAWWQTVWFRAGVVLQALLAGVLAVRAWSHRRLRRQLAELERATALERERARIARNIHDDLGSGLTRISLLTQAPETADARTQLDRIYQTVGDLTQSMDEFVWAVNPKNDNLEGFANYLVEYAQG